MFQEGVLLWVRVCKMGGVGIGGTNASKIQVQCLLDTMTDHFKNPLFHTLLSSRGLKSIHRPSSPLQGISPSPLSFKLTHLHDAFW